MSQPQLVKRVVGTLDSLGIAIMLTGSGGSEKQWTDALRVYELQAGTLDLAYLDRWAADLGLADDWSRLKSNATPLGDVS